MLRMLLERKINAAEKGLNADVAHLRFMLRTSISAFYRFLKVYSYADYRKVLPLETAYVARIVAVQAEDCGACVQAVVNIAKKKGVSSAVIKNVVAQRPGELPEHLQEVYRFTEAVVRKNGDEGDWRERLRERYGDEGIVELSLGIALARVFPTTKRALGYATHCHLVEVEV